MLAGVVALVGATGTSLDTAVTLLFAVAGVGIVALARRLAIGPRGVAATAAVGLLSHPFGDLMTGEPPALLFPFDVSLFESYVALHPDPTVHLLAAFAIELTIVWLAFLTYLRLGDRDPWAVIDRRAIAGIGYGGAAVVIPAPTLSAADPFVFSVLAVGAIGVAPLPARYRTAVPRAIGTGLAAVVPIAPFQTTTDRWVLPPGDLTLAVERDETPVDLLLDGRVERTVSPGEPVTLSADDGIEILVVAESRDFF
jgi:hypothetical protein